MSVNKNSAGIMEAASLVQLWDFQALSVFLFYFCEEMAADPINASIL